MIVKRIISKGKRILINAFNNIKGKAGLLNETFINARGATIITYHGICEKDPLKYNTLFITAKTFEAHLQFYKKHFHVLSIDEFYEKKFHSDKFNICITFDDGFYNNYKYALPLLKKYELPAIFFITAIRETGYDILWNDYLSITTKYGSKKLVFKNESFVKDRFGKYVSEINNGSLSDKLKSTNFEDKKELMLLKNYSTLFSENKDFWLQMSEAEIKDLSSYELSTIGSHGYYHNDLAQINIGDAVKEMEDSKMFLEKIINKEIKSIAFPYGSYNELLVKEAVKVGYTQLLALDLKYPQDINSDIIQKRMVINPFSSVNNQMLAIIKGKYK